MTDRTPPELDHLRHILTRDLGALAAEVRETPDDLLWESAPGITNSVGTLAIHLCGNLRHFIGHHLGDALSGRLVEPGPLRSQATSKSCPLV